MGRSNCCGRQHETYTQCPWSEKEIVGDFNVGFKWFRKSSVTIFLFIILTFVEQLIYDFSANKELSKKILATIYNHGPIVKGAVNADQKKSFNEFRIQIQATNLSEVQLVYFGYLSFCVLNIYCSTNLYSALLYWI